MSSLAVASTASATALLSLVGKVAIVTGSTSGMGARSAELLAARGAKVVVSGRRQPQGEAIVAGIKASGGEAMFIRCDVSKESEVESLIKQAVSAYGRLDIAFNNAGVLDMSSGSPHTTSNDAYDHQYDINVRGLHYCMKYEVKQFLEQRAKDGMTGQTDYAGAERINPNTLYTHSHPYSIINNSSIFGLRGANMLYVYSSSKFAVMGLTRSAAQGYAKSGIRVNAICPGFITSGNTSSAGLDMMLPMVPMGRLGQGDEVAELVGFLASTASSFITGAAIPIDGGYLA